MIGVTQKTTSIRWLCLSLVSLLLLSQSSRADDFKADEFQASVLKVVEKASPAVVAVLDRSTTFSGVIVSADGYVLSAGHAVRPNRRYRLVLNDGRTVSARGLGANEKIDCALLKITESGSWPFAEMGTSSQLVENQPCLSISHPGRFDRNRGVVARLGYIVDPLSHSGMIQSTAKMEPGDSGGPLFDLDGRVIGIHSNIRRSMDRNYEVPIDAFKKFWDELKSGESIDDHRWPALPTLGFEAETVEEGGYLKVTRVDDGQTASRSGLRLGDHLVSVAQRRVRNIDDMIEVFKDLAISNRNPFPVKVRRENGEVELKFDYQSAQAKPASFRELNNLAQSFQALEDRLDDWVVGIESQLNGKSSSVWATRIKGDPLRGNLVTKSSRVGNQPVAIVNGRRLAAEVVRRDENNDLALLRVSLPGAGGVDLNQLPGDMFQQPGKLLLTPDPEGDGEVSVWGSKYFNAPRSPQSGGFLGVRIGSRDGEVFFSVVMDDLAAAAAGLAAGDVLLKINDKDVQDQAEVFDFLRRSDPYDSIRVLVSRDGQELEKQVVLGARPEESRHVADQLKGGKSVRRDGFQLVVSHDADVFPERCGGPVFDLKGEFLGINIARHSRARTYVVPKTTLQRFVNGQ